MSEDKIGYKYHSCLLLPLLFYKKILEFVNVILSSQKDYYWWMNSLKHYILAWNKSMDNFK